MTHIYALLGNRASELFCGQEFLMIASIAFIIYFLLGRSDAVIHRFVGLKQLIEDIYCERGCPGH